MSVAWLVVVGSAIVTMAIKASGPLILGTRHLPAVADRVMSLLAPVLLSAFVATQTVGSGHRIVLDARAAGLSAAALCIALRAPLLVTVIAAAIVTAGLRLVRV